MGTLATIWAASQTDAQRNDLATMARQLDTLATAFGHARPESVPAPSALQSSDPASRIDAWESWYNAAPVSTSGLPPTSVFGQPATTSPATWSALYSLARSRSAPAQVSAYLSVQQSSWDSARPHWSSTTALSAAFNGAELAAETWWYNRIGGTSGAMSDWTRGDVTPSGANIPPPVGTNPPTHGGEDNTVRNIAIAIGLYLLGKHLSKR